MDNEYTHMLSLYNDAQINYSLYFLRLYISFNAWYRLETGLLNDREALRLIEKVMADHWQNVREAAGEYGTKTWGDALSAWYRIRCSVAHGTEVSRVEARDAYLSLNSYMTHITATVRVRFDMTTERKLFIVSSLLNHDPETVGILEQMHAKLSAQYVSQ